MHFDVVQLVRGKTIHSALHHTLPFRVHLQGRREGGRVMSMGIRIRVRSFHSTFVNTLDILMDLKKQNILINYASSGHDCKI